VFSFQFSVFSVQFSVFSIRFSGFRVQPNQHRTAVKKERYLFVWLKTEH
jgi:hypothetical protein